MMLYKYVQHSLQDGMQGDERSSVESTQGGAAHDFHQLYQPHSIAEVGL